mmetsp:Transcript_21089/g.43101  ORF Transcript_21089/g.43101 Transcript_21089/m.43101 type:complete len:142 (-) Transcript_21089:649-1074(-)
MAMKAYSECKDENAVARAEELFRRMDNLHRDGRYSMKPDVLTVNALIKCWINSIDGDVPVQPERVLGLLGNMLSSEETRQRPNDETFDLALRLLLQSGDAEAARRVEAAWTKLKGGRGSISSSSKYGAISPPRPPRKDKNK